MFLLPIFLLFVIGFSACTVTLAAERRPVLASVSLAFLLACVGILVVLAAEIAKYPPARMILKAALSFLS